MVKYSDIRVGTLAGIPIRLDISLSLIVLIWGIDGLCQHGLSGLFFSTLCCCFLYLSIFVHELGHALVAKKLKILSTGIQIMPLFGFTHFKEEAPPTKSIAISMAGPLTNLLLAVLMLIPIQAFGGWDAITTTYHQKTLIVPSLGNFCIFLCMLNLALGLFNLLPVYPFDGGRILQSTFLMYLPRNRALHLSAVITQLVAVLVFIWGVWSGNILMAFFMGIVFGLARIQRRANPWKLSK